MSQLGAEIEPMPVEVGGLRDRAFGLMTPGAPTRSLEPGRSTWRSASRSGLRPPRGPSRLPGWLLGSASARSWMRPLRSTKAPRKGRCPRSMATMSRPRSFRGEQVGGFPPAEVPWPSSRSRPCSINSPTRLETAARERPVCRAISALLVAPSSETSSRVVRRLLRRESCRVALV